MRAISRAGIGMLTPIIAACSQSPPPSDLRSTPAEVAPSAGPIGYTHSGANGASPAVTDTNTTVPTHKPISTAPPLTDGRISDGTMTGLDCVEQWKDLARTSVARLSNWQLGLPGPNVTVGFAPNIPQSKDKTKISAVIPCGVVNGNNLELYLFIQEVEGIGTEIRTVVFRSVPPGKYNIIDMSNNRVLGAIDTAAQSGGQF